MVTRLSSESLGQIPSLPSRLMSCRGYSHHILLKKRWIFPTTDHPPVWILRCTPQWPVAAHDCHAMREPPCRWLQVVNFDHLVKLSYLPQPACTFRRNAPYLKLSFGFSAWRLSRPYKLHHVKWGKKSASKHESMAINPSVLVFFGAYLCFLGYVIFSKHQSLVSLVTWSLANVPWRFWCSK